MNQTTRTTTPVFLLVCLLAFALHSPGTPAQETAPESTQASEKTTPHTAATDAIPAELIARNACAATVGVYCHTGTDRYYGSGFVITSGGYILSSTTVVPSGAQDILVYFPDHTTLKAELVASYPELETVILKVNPVSNLPVLPLNPILPKLGSPAYTAGNSGGMIKLGDGASFSAGLVSGIYHISSADRQSGYQGLAIETDAAVTPGQDGGPLLDCYGNVCGIISRSYSLSRFQGTAIPISLILPRIPQNIRRKTLTAAVMDSSPSDLWLTKLDNPIKAIVAIEVERQFKAEKIRREDWAIYRLGIKDWDNLSPQEQRRMEADFFAADTLLGANQIIRRPAEMTTGIIISTDGYILTSAFNVQSSDMVFLHGNETAPNQPVYNGDLEKIKADHSSSYRKELNSVKRVTVRLPNGELTSASIHGFDLNLGLALLKINVEGKLHCFDIREASAKPRTGEHVSLLGVSPDGKSPTINGGIISAPSRDEGRLIQFDALLNYGNSGGPVLSSDGRFLGMAISPLLPVPIMGKVVPYRNPPADPGTLSLSDFKRFPNNGISLAASAKEINKSIDNMLQGKGIRRSASTIPGFRPAADNAFSTRVVVGKLAADSPAWKAGLREGDQILSVEGLGVRSWKEFTDLVSQKSPGDIVELWVQRPLHKPYLQVGQHKLSTPQEIGQYLQSLPDGTNFSGVYHKPSVKLTIMLILQKGR